MIQFALTVQQADHLHDLLAHLVQDGPAPTRRDAAQLLALLTTAQQTAIQSHQCPICQRWFTQPRAGRMGIYCSAACKQKAYRQRKRTWLQNRPSQPAS